MKELLVCLTVFVTSTLAIADGFTAFKQSPDGAHLVLIGPGKLPFEAPKYADQVGAVRS